MYEIQPEKKDVFISYHIESSTEIVEKISEALEGVGISTWYAKREIIGNYAGKIMEAINECKVFLIVLNQYSQISVHCLNEINAVYNRLSKQENVVILPFKIDKCELDKDAYYYLGRIHILDGSLPPEMERVGELVNRVSTILGRKSSIEGVIKDNETKEKHHYRIVGTTVTKSSGFIGRKKELQEIYNKLSAYPNKLILIGMGGIGKSEITKAYCHNYRNNYDVVVWVSFEESLRKTIANDFSFAIGGMERGDYPTDDDFTYFQRKLKVLREIADEKVLIVVDNFDVMEDEDMEAFCQGSYSVLFTTRFHEISEDVPKMYISEISDENEMLEMFQAEYKKNLDGEGLEQVKKLLRNLKGHPLSIRLVASVMKSNRISPEKILSMLGGNEKQTDKRKDKAMDMVTNRLRQVFSVSSLTCEEINVLKNLVLTPLGGIEVEKFYEWCDFSDYEIIDGLVRKSWVVYNSAEDKVHLHPLIKDVMAVEINKDTSCCEQILDTLLGNIDDLSRMNFEEKCRFYECFGSASKNLPETHPKKWEVRWGYAKMLMEMSYYEEAMITMRELFTQTQELARKLNIASRISQGYILTGRTEQGIYEAKAGLKLIEEIPLEQLSQSERRERKNLYVRLNETYRNKKEYNTAENCMRMVLEDTEKFPGETSMEQIGWYYIHLGRVLSYKGNVKDWEESRQLFEKCLEIFGSRNNTTATGYTYMFYGQLNMYEGKFEEAFEKTRLALEYMLPGMGEQHIDIAKIKLFEANIHRARGDEQNAIICYKQSAEMMRQRGNKLLAEKVLEVMNSEKIGYTN